MVMTLRFERRDKEAGSRLLVFVSIVCKDGYCFFGSYTNWREEALFNLLRR